MALWMAQNQVLARVAAHVIVYTKPVRMRSRNHTYMWHPRVKCSVCRDNLSMQKFLVWRVSLLQSAHGPWPLLLGHTEVKYPRHRVPVN